MTAGGRATSAFAPLLRRVAARLCKACCRLDVAKTMLRALLFTFAAAALAQSQEDDYEVRRAWIEIWL